MQWYVVSPQIYIVTEMHDTTASLAAGPRSSTTSGKPWARHFSVAMVLSSARLSGRLFGYTVGTYNLGSFALHDNHGQVAFTLRGLTKWVVKSLGSAPMLAGWGGREWEGGWEWAGVGGRGGERERRRGLCEAE